MALSTLPHNVQMDAAYACVIESLHVDILSPAWVVSVLSTPYMAVDMKFRCICHPGMLDGFAGRDTVSEMTFGSCAPSTLPARKQCLIHSLQQVPQISRIVQRSDLRAFLTSCPTGCVCTARYSSVESFCAN